MTMDVIFKSCLIWFGSTTAFVITSAFSYGQSHDQRLKFNTEISNIRLDDDLQSIEIIVRLVNETPYDLFLESGNLSFTLEVVGETSLVGENSLLSIGISPDSIEPNSFTYVRAGTDEFGRNTVTRSIAVPIEMLAAVREEIGEQEGPFVFSISFSQLVASSSKDSTSFKWKSFEVKASSSKLDKKYLRSLLSGQTQDGKPKTDGGNEAEKSNTNSELIEQRQENP